VRTNIDTPAICVGTLIDRTPFVSKDGRASRHLPYIAIFNKARRDSVRRGIPFEIAFEFYLSLIGLPCHYCGIPLKWSQSKSISLNG